MKVVLIAEGMKAEPNFVYIAPAKKQIGISNGMEAISIYKTDSSIDLILMDMQMPVLDGYEATKVIRNLEIEEKKNKKMPIITLTAYAMEDERGECIDAGMDDYIAKPITANQLLGSIENFL